MATLSSNFKRTVADLYLENRKNLEELDPNAMESFASELLEMINEEKRKYEDLRGLLAEIAEKYGQQIKRTSRESLDDALLEALKAFDSEISIEEENQRKSSWKSYLP